MKKGFTLIEVLIAIVLAAGGLMVLMHLMSIAIFADSNVESNLQALNLANEKLEELKNSGYRDPNLDPDDSPFIETSVTGFGFVDLRLWTVAYVDPNLDPSASRTGLKDVAVEVRWTQDAETQSVVVESLIADY